MSTARTPVTRTTTVLRLLGVIVAVVAIGVVAWAVLTAGEAIAHAHPAYPVLLGVAVALAILALVLLARRRRRGGVGRTARRIVLLVLAAAGIALLAWLRPFPAVEPALGAMRSDAAVTVSESPTEIVLTPEGDARGPAVFFQPGALVDARAYAAVLRPQAEQGRLVVIAKQPLGIAFLATGAFDEARARFPDVAAWALGGHSLGGTVAAIQADAGQHDAHSPAVALFFYASYPASDLSASLRIPVASISGSRDGLATPAKIAASRANLPADTVFTEIDGADHAQFGAYGPQPGDRPATIDASEAREQITEATTRFLGGLD